VFPIKFFEYLATGKPVVVSRLPALDGFLDSVRVADDEQSFVVKTNGQSGFLDFESSKPDKVTPEVAGLFDTVVPAKGGVLIVHGWTMAEDLVKLGKRV